MQRIVARELPALPLYCPTMYTAFRKSAFDRWHYTPGGYGGGIPGPHNKQVLVTGSKVGLAIRQSV